MSSSKRFMEERMKMPVAEQTLFFADNHFNQALVETGLVTDDFVSIFAFQTSPLLLPTEMTYEFLEETTLNLIASSKRMPDKWIPIVLVNEWFFVSPEVKNVFFRGATYDIRNEKELTDLKLAALLVKEEKLTEQPMCPECGNLAFDLKETGLWCEFCKTLSKPQE